MAMQDITDPYIEASKRARQPLVSATESVMQSGADMTNRLTKNGAVGFPLAVGKEIVGGLNQLGGAVGSKANSIDARIDANRNQPSDINYDKAMPFLIGKESAQKRLDERNQPAAAQITDPSTAGVIQQVNTHGMQPQNVDPAVFASAITPTFIQGAPVKPVQAGINGSIIDPKINRVQPRQNAYEGLQNPSNSMSQFVDAGNQNIIARGEGAQRNFNDDNYTQTQVANSGIANPGAGTNPAQQLEQMRIMKLQEAASMPVDNSLPYDEKRTLSGQRRAAQKTLSLMMPSRTADKNRASNYQSDQSKALLSTQKGEAKAAMSKLKEKRLFSEDSLFQVDMGDSPMTQAEQVGLSLIPASEGRAAKAWLQKKSGSEIREFIASGELDRYGLKGDRLVIALGLGDKLKEK